jgi:hypothetical protein
MFILLNYCYVNCKLAFKSVNSELPIVKFPPFTIQCRLVKEKTCPSGAFDG